MKWIITEDKIETNGVGQGNFKGDPATLPYEFRLLDGDDLVYYVGRTDDQDSQAAFHPLDAYGEPNAGCTTIQYKRNGAWVTL